VGFLCFDMQSKQFYAYKITNGDAPTHREWPSLWSPSSSAPNGFTRNS
jgi:hypothetical protein